jgi:hypothetical protein
MLRRSSVFFSWAALVKVNTPCNDRIAIDAEKLVMGNGVIGIDLRGQPRIGEEVSGGVLPGAPTLIEDDLDVYPWVWASTKAIAIGAEVKLEVWTRMLVLAGPNILTIMSVQFPLGVKQTITLARFVALLEPLASPISNSPSVSIGRIYPHCWHPCEGKPTQRRREHLPVPSASSVNPLLSPLPFLRSRRDSKNSENS